MNPQQLKNIIEAALLTAGRPLPMVRLQALFVEEDEPPEVDEIKQLLDELGQHYSDRGIELKLVSSGYRIQATQDMAQWLHRLNEERPTRYSRALLETLALMAYRQPITRAGVEDIRGVSVSSSIVKTLLEREWIRVVGHRDVPGRPALYGTTKEFLDYFNLKSLSDLPPLAEMRSIEDIQKEFDLNFFKGEPAVDAEKSEADNEPAAEQDSLESADDSLAEDGQQTDADKDPQQGPEQEEEQAQDRGHDSGEEKPSSADSAAHLAPAVVTDAAVLEASGAVTAVTDINQEQDDADNSEDRSPIKRTGSEAADEEADDLVIIASSV